MGCCCGCCRCCCCCCCCCCCFPCCCCCCCCGAAVGVPVAVSFLFTIQWMYSLCSAVRQPPPIESGLLRLMGLILSRQCRAAREFVVLGCLDRLFSWRMSTLMLLS